MFITVFEDYDEEMIQQYYLMKRDESTFDLPFMLIANADVCEECKMKNADLFDAMLRRPVTVPAILTNVFEIAGPLCEKRHDDSDDIYSARGKHMRPTQSVSAGSYDRIGNFAPAAEKIIKKHILVVDDDKDILRMLKSALEDKYDVTTVSSGRMAENYDVPPDLPLSLKGDNVRIQQVLINLLNNAVKFTRSGNISLKISTRPISDENVMLVASVSDTGCGISQENIGRLFKMFRQIDSKRNRNVEGTGLGLAISKKLLGLMGGTISVESEPGKGSTFTFEVPQEITKEEHSVVQSAPAGTVACLLLANQYLRKSVETAVREIGAVPVSIDHPLLGDKAYVIADYELLNDAKELVARNPGLKCILIDRFDSTAYSDDENITIVRKPVYSFPLSAAMGIGEKFTRSDDTESNVSFTAPEAYVLIVDDNDINRAVAKGVIEPLGMQVDLAASGAECIEKARNFRYDIIFMDHMMPEMDGIEAAHII